MYLFSLFSVFYWSLVFVVCVVFCGISCSFGVFRLDFGVLEFSVVVVSAFVVVFFGFRSLCCFLWYQLFVWGFSS